MPQTVYLTFDDGPVAGVTDRILDLLDARGQRATFFCVGANLDRNPDIARRAHAAGHRLANHTYTHRDAWQTPHRQYLDEVARTDARLAELTGERPRHFRPPYGKITPWGWWALRQSHRLVWWHAIAWDWNRSLSPEVCLRNLLRGLGPGRIAVMHDSEKAAERVLGLLPGLLDEMDRREWRSEPIS